MTQVRAVHRRKWPKEHDHMINDSKCPPIAGAASAPAKKTYSRPILQAFGKVGRLTHGSATVGNDAGLAMNKNQQSDRGAKENIVRVGNHPLGIGLYLFDYRAEFRDEWGHGRQLGVMADEVETVVPDAVSVHANGLKVVDYSKLGIDRAQR